MALALELQGTNIAIKEIENPFHKRKTDSGLILLDGMADSQETGEMETLNQVIGFGVVTYVGPDVTTLKVNDGVYYDRRTPKPIPFNNDPVWFFNVGNVIGIVRENEAGELAALIAQREEEAAAETRKTALAFNTRPDHTGLKLV